MDNPTYKEFKNIDWIDLNFSLLRIYVKAYSINLKYLLHYLGNYNYDGLQNMSEDALYNFAKEELPDINFTTFEGEQVFELNDRDISDEFADNLTVHLYNGSYNLVILGQ